MWKEERDPEQTVQRDPLPVGTPGTRALSVHLNRIVFIYSFIQGMKSWVSRITSIPFRPCLSFKQDTEMEVFVWSWCSARCDKSPALWSHYMVHGDKKRKENAIWGETKHADRSTWSANFPSITLVHVRWVFPFPQEWTGERDPYGRFSYSHRLFSYDSRRTRATKPSVSFYYLFSELSRFVHVLYHYHLLSERKF